MTKWMMMQALKTMARLCDTAWKAGYVRGIADTLAEIGPQGAFKDAAYTDAPELRYKPSCGRLGPKLAQVDTRMAKEARRQEGAALRLTLDKNGKRARRGR